MSTSEQNQSQTAIEAGKQIANVDGRIKEFAGVPVSVTPDSMSVNVMTELLAAQDARADAPRKLRGTSKMTEEISFIEQVNRSKDGSSVIFSSGDKFIAVLDYNKAIPTGLPAGDTPARDAFARWGLHRAEYAPPFSAEWKLWIGQAGQAMEQVPFADFIEANMSDVAEPTAERNTPTAADLYTVATKLKIQSNDTCEASIDRVTGESTILSKTENNPTGSTKIPREFDISIAVFDGGEPQRVTVKFRMSKQNGAVKFGFVIPTADRIRRAALLAIRTRIATATSLPMLAGAPEA